MKDWLEKIVYGNPTSDQLELMQKVSEYDYLLPEMFEAPCPSNISTLTQDELVAIVEYQKQYNYLQPAVKKRYMAYDADLVKSVANFVYNRFGIDITELFQNIVDETKPILLKLKYHFQRPRPYVLAQYYRQSVFPILTPSAISPSFPSGHVFQMALLTETLGSAEPRTYNDLNNLLLDICEQRLFYRLHYPSDNDTAILFAKKIVQSKEWTTKYNI